MPRAKSDNTSLDEKLLRLASSRTGCVLRPYPVDIDAHEVDSAIERMREQGWVHGSRREPNLTRAGIEAAKSLVEA